MKLKENVKLVSYKTPYFSFADTETKTAEEDENKPKETCVNRFRGLLLASASGIFMSLSSAIVKKMNVFSGELGFIRSLSIGIFALPLAVLSGKEFFRNKTLVTLLLLRSFFDTFSIFFKFETMQRLPLADANVIIFTSPVVVAVLARFVLKEKCSLYLVLSLITTMMGLILVVKLPLINSEEGAAVIGEKFKLIGVAFGLASVFFNASMFIVIRKIKKELHRTVIIFHLGWTSTIFSLGITAAFGQFTMPNPVTFEPWWLLVMGFFSFIGQLLLTSALQLEHAGPVSIARACSDIVSAFIWEILFFSDKPDVYSISGAVLVTLGGVVLNLSKWVVELPDSSVTKKKLKCLTL